MTPAVTPQPDQQQAQPTLAQRIRAKFPGEYDDMDDPTLEGKVLAKYPEYSDLPRTPPPAKSPAPPINAHPSVWNVLTQPTDKTDAEYGSYRGAAGVAGATIKGLDDVARGTQGAIKGMYDVVRHPIDTAKGIASLPSQAAQVPAAIKDINASPDPTGTYLNVAQDTASQGAGQALTALGTEGVVRSAPWLRDKVPSSVPAKLYQSALKPSTTIMPAKVARMVQTGLQEGIPVSAGGAEKLATLIDDVNAKIAAEIAAKGGPTPWEAAPNVKGLLPSGPEPMQSIPLAEVQAGKMPGGLLPAKRPPIPESEFSPEARIARGDSGLSRIRLTDASGPGDPYKYYTTSGEGEIPPAPQPTAGVLLRPTPREPLPWMKPGVSINPQEVASRLDGVKAKFANQVNPEADLAAIDDAKQEFLRNNPQPIPAAKAQAMKQGTYQQLGSKAYGEMKTPTIEAQKALARGLKEELANAFPELNSLNAQDAKLLDLKPVLEKAIQREANHQLGGIGTPIMAGAAKAVTGSNMAAAVAAFMKGIVDNPYVKSRLAIALSKSGSTLPAANARIQAYSAALAASAANVGAHADRTNEQPK